MKSTLKKITAAIIALSFVVTSTNFILPPKPVNAQAGKATACAAGYIAAGLSALASIPQNIIGVSKSQVGDTAQHVTTGGSANSLSFNECILKPLAKVMIVTIIRNIGASVVNWVNSGFEGKPSFVTDFGGTLLDAADETVGQFIEGSELGFLCNNFSFQIRIALALKYSQPFREKARCSLTTIANNVSSFTNDNGGAGWDNWLRLTTEPQNNVYGAFMIADSELASRATQAVTQKKDRISIAQGFLDYETCDAWETQLEQGEREELGEEPIVEVTNNNTALGALQSSFATSSRNGADVGYVKSGTKFTDPTGQDRKCTKKSTKTPGGIIAGKLNSEFAKGDIQQAVATEIDDVIAATMNQLAQKMIQGATGLLGLSQKKNGSNRQSYMQKYQNQYYGGNAAQTIDPGATSDIEDYTVANYDVASTLIQNNNLVQEIYTATDDTANTAVDSNRSQQNAINDAIGADGNTEQNLSFFKPTSQSSAGAGTSDRATNGIKDGNASPQNIVTSTGEDQDAWWEVDLEESKPIKEVRIWKVTNKPVVQTLETFFVIATDANGQNVWTSSPITPTQSGPNPIVVNLNNISRQHIRIQKQSTYDDQCRFIPSQYRGESEYEGCYHPLELAEVEVIGTVNRATSITGLNGIASTTSGTTAGTNAPTPVIQKTLDLVASSTLPLTMTGSNPFKYDVSIVANHSTSSLSVENTFKRDGQTVRVGSIFSNLTVTTRRGSGSSAITNVNLTSPSLIANSLSVSATDKFTFSFVGQKSVNALSGSYVLESVLFDARGNVLKTQTTNFVIQ